MRRAVPTLGAILLGALAVLASPAAARSPLRVIAPTPGHAIVAIGVDAGRVLLGENPSGDSGCARLVLVRLRGATTTLTQPAGPTCASGGRLDEASLGARTIGLALDRAMWRVQLPDGGALIASGGSGEAEQVMARASAGSATALGPVVAQHWLRLYGSVRGGSGWITSGNRKVKWRSATAYAPVGLDDAEHVVAVGPSGAIAMFHPHGAVYARSVAADALTAAVDGAAVLVLRRDRRTMDVRGLDGDLRATHRLRGRAAAAIDACNGLAVYVGGGGVVRAISLGAWRDVVLHRPAPGMRVLDVQVAPRFVAVLERGPAAPRGRVVLYAR